MTYIECPEGEEQGPAIEGTAPYCVPADEPLPVESSVPIFMPVEPIGPAPIEEVPVESFPPALPLDGARELAETGGAEVLNILLVAAILFVAGLATWLTRSR